MMIREMTHNECAATIAAQRLARLACAENDSPYVVPICYACSASRLFAFSMPRKKLDILHANPRACLLADATEELHEERLKAWALLAKDFDWWEPGALKPQPQPVVTTSPHVFFELKILAMSGREAMSETSEMSH